tara:strand:+ start:3672 stop:4874 length:1203 start_codon:yes stop_codon:yes gene_type:complete
MAESDGVRKIAVVIVDRANYGRLKPVMAKIRSHSQLELFTICTGTMLLDRFGKAVNIVRNDGFRVDDEIFVEIEGSNPNTAAKTLGLSIIEFVNAFNRIKPDIILCIGDRFEMLGAMLAASYQNYCIAHIQGGEVSYSNDEMARHVMTKLAHYHYPATTRAGKFLEMMGEDPDTIFSYGCPVADVIQETNLKPPPGFLKGKGIGGPIDLKKDYFVVIFHPISTQYYSKMEQVSELLDALQEIKMPTLWLWANIDPGSDDINRTIRMHREYVDENWLQVAKNFEPDDFQMILSNARMAIGNSSSFVRDASIHGLPVVLLGDRQKGREITENVMHCQDVEKKSITKSIKAQMANEKYESSDLYGKPGVARKIVDSLASVKIYNQKHLHYVNMKNNYQFGNIL